MDQTRRAVLRHLSQFALVALPGPRFRLGGPIDAQPLAAQAGRIVTLRGERLGVDRAAEAEAGARQRDERELRKVAKNLSLIHI